MSAADKTLLRRAICENIHPGRVVKRYRRASTRPAILRQYLIRMITFLQFIRRACFSYHLMQLIVNTGVYFL